jgi:hypothetical protein
VHRLQQFFDGVVDFAADCKIRTGRQTSGREPDGEFKAGLQKRGLVCIIPGYEKDDSSLGG